jgi:SAM-dependent methyltransferase
VDRTLRTTFDEAAELYERARPAYPDELFDDLIAVTGLEPGSRVVEIGPGTGKATLPLAGRGMRVTGIELGASLAALAQRKLALFPGVQIVNADFETWRPERADYDAVVAFTSFHWIPPELRYLKSAALLRKGGALAVTMVHHVLPDDADPFFVASQADYDAAGVGGEPPGPPESVAGLGEEIEATGLFEVAAERRYLWDVVYTADELIGVLSTYSPNIAMEEGRRSKLFDLLRARIGDGTVRKTYLATLDVAVRI